MRRERAFTLIELLVVVALVAIVLTLAAPSFSNFVVVQRLKSINSQLVTDLQLARSEAASRGNYVRLAFGANASMTCYTIYTQKYGADLSDRCDCLQPMGSACGSTEVEIRTVQVPASSSVQIQIPAGVDPAFAFDFVTGGLMSIPNDNFASPMNGIDIYTRIDSARSLHTSINQNGRPSVCGSTGTLGAPLC